MSQRVSGTATSGQQPAPSPSTPETATGPHPQAASATSAPSIVCGVLLVVAVLALAATFIYAFSTFD